MCLRVKQFDKYFLEDNMMNLKNLFFQKCIVFFTTALFLGHGLGVCSADVLDFEEFALGGNSFFDGYGAGASTGSWTSQGVQFNTNQFGPGWSYSNVNDTTTAGFTNQWAAFTGTGFGGSGNYALANSFDPNGAIINFAETALLFNVEVTNGTFPAISMRDGDAFSKQFGGPSGNDPDFFSVTFTGFSDVDATGTATGSVEFFLADFRFADNSLDFIVDQWVNVDLQAIGPARSIAVSFNGSDVGSFGLNTPAYVAIDNLSFQTVPEPSACLLVLSAFVGLSVRRNRSQK